MCRWFGIGKDATWFLPVLFTVGAIISLSSAEYEKTGASNSVSSARPKIQLLQIGKAWENITGKGGVSSSRINSIYSPKGDDLFLSCTAKYPIQWNISGIIDPTEVVKIQQPKRNLKENIFQIQVNIFFLDAENYKALAASANIACEQVDNSQNRDVIAVFVKGNDRQCLLTPRDTELEGEVSVIPCPTTDPKETSTLPTLFFRDLNARSEKQIKDVVYSPTEGFRLSSNSKNKLFRAGTYTCRQLDQSVSITVVNQLPSDDTHFAPVSRLVRRFSDEFIEFHCSSTTKPVNFVVDNNSDTALTFVTNSETNKVARLSQVESSSAEKPVLNGKLACLTANDGQLVKEWEWEFVQPPQLHLDNLEGEADCLTSLTPKVVQTVRCKNAMDCDFMGESCLGNVSLCNFKKQKQFYADVDTYCWVEHLKKGLPCVSVPFSHLNGVVQCGIMGLTRQWEFFISLDYIRYSHWKEAPLRELVRIEEISENAEDSDVSAPTHLVCTASAFLFADSIAFEINLKDGSRTLVQNTALKNSPHDHDNKGSRQILELYVKATLDMKMIPKDAVSVDCLAPFWNSTSIQKTTKLLSRTGKRMSGQVSKLGKPALLESTGQEDTLTFYTGQKEKRLNCTSDLDKSEPTWLYRAKPTGSFENVTKVFPELKTGMYDESKKGYLEFPVVGKMHSGEYQCVKLSNNNNNNMDDNSILATYKLQVTVEPLATSTTVYVGLTILILVIVGLVIAGFAVFLQKRNT